MCKIFTQSFLLNKLATHTYFIFTNCVEKIILDTSQQTQRFNTATRVLALTLAQITVFACGGLLMTNLANAKPVVADKKVLGVTKMLALCMSSLSQS